MDWLNGIFDDDEESGGLGKPDSTLMGPNRTQVEGTSLPDLVAANTASSASDDDDDNVIKINVPQEQPAAPPPAAAPPPSSVNPDIKNAIEKRSQDNPLLALLSRKIPTLTAKDLENDPLMKDYQKREDQTTDLRNAQMGANKILNLSQSFGQFSRGAQAPNNASQDLAENVSKQGNELIKGKEQELDRRQKIINSIESRKEREAIANEGLQNRAAVALQSQNNKDTTRQLRQDQILGRAYVNINTDPVIKPAELNLESLKKSKGILDNDSVPLSSQSLSDAEQDIASALSLRGMGATEGKINRTELVDLNRKIAEFKQKWGNNIQDLRKKAPELVDQIKKLNSALIDDYTTTVSKRKNGIVDDLKTIYGDSPEAIDKLEKLRSSFNSRLQPPSSVEQPGKEPSPHGDHLNQDGVDFIWDGYKYVPQQGG